MATIAESMSTRKMHKKESLEGYFADILYVLKIV